MIKGRKTVSLLLAMLLCLLVPAAVGATNGIDLVVGDEIRVFVDGERLSLDVSPFIEDDRTIVPMAPIFNALGAGVTWDEETRTVTAKRGDTVVELVIDEEEAKVNGKTEFLDAPARIVSGRTFVPLRFVSQAFNAEPIWDGEARTINISRPVSVTKLTLSPSELSLHSGQTSTLTVKALLDDQTEETVEGASVSWRSTNTGVATVEGGIVKAVGPGTTEINATYREAFATVNIKVDENLSGISIRPISLSLEVGDKSSLNIIGHYTDQEQQSIPAEGVSWSSSNGSVATVTAGEVTALSPGTTRITAAFHNQTATAHVEVFRDMPVEIRDVGLREAIRSALNKPAGDLLRSDLAKLTELDAYNLLIEDLSGIEYCTNLRSLSLERNYIRDITPLTQLKGLERLRLGYNQVADLTPLAGLENLRWLSLNNNRATSTAGLKDLTKLRWLSLAGNEIYSIDALENMHELETLNISANRVSSLRPLTELTGLVTLHIWENEVSDLSPLSGLTRLTTVNAWRNNISNVSPLAGLNNLSWLAIGNNQLDLSGIDLRRLRERGVFVSTENF